MCREKIVLNLEFFLKAQLSLNFKISCQVKKESCCIDREFDEF